MDRVTGRKRSTTPSPAKYKNACDVDKQREKNQTQIMLDNQEESDYIINT